MNIPTLRIQTTDAQISISTTKGKQSIQQPPATVEMKQLKAEMKITTTPGKLTIDQSQAWADMDRKNILQRNREAAAEAVQKAWEGIGRRASEGRELAAIHKGGNPIAEQAVRHTRRNFETGIGWIPSHGSVKIDYQPGDVQIEANARPVEYKATMNKPVIRYEPGDVNIELVQKPSVHIEVVNKTI
ncbi:DUF6470 family protein [Domibacillus sp. DTU_2020_1001157_1_SI_ALB_TIR_016]|uniref:DUF6470 family protein n=1 Tax=Domibacillus sp. DTU_2020_1001157_1_SI_ALB_TIR_016 TaxID=3077789 RepID=UPI0028E3C559|nr:DUF6470 family protein [Domibacillus sp. DTU_2020_1001157_1_SI_ALB_TIR_016]WNS81299.1 DUF6470 family protein [Domibacillus sp. DTU_2020_1001157_1_SI_ALB_TIR_016]